MNDATATQGQDHGLGPRRLESNEQYTVGWIAALDLELAVAIEMLDELHGQPLGFLQPAKDYNVYTFGCIGEHNVVIASLSSGIYGTTSAAETVLPMINSFPNIKFGLLVGIGAGTPQLEKKLDIRLGDVAISQPDGTNGGVYLHDLGKAKTGGEWESKGFLNMPPRFLLTALSRLKAEHKRKPSKVLGYLSKLPELMLSPEDEEPGYAYQGAANDRLFESSYHHKGGFDCVNCDPEGQVTRSQRKNTNPRFHYGIIASGNILVKDPLRRDEIVRQTPGSCICFEMEAAGLMNSIPCLVIRGICDYADSHKNDQWQPYAAATAAAYAKELLGFVPAADVMAADKITNILKSMERSLENVEKVAEQLQCDLDECKLRDWLLPPEFATGLKKASDQRQKGSCQWFLRSRNFMQWRMKRKSFLWIHGIPGCGKTVLASAIVEHLYEGKSAGIEYSGAVLYFFFNFQEQQKKPCDELLPALLIQLLSRPGSKWADLRPLYKACQMGERKPSTDQLVSTFSSLCENYGEISLIIDGLDEIYEVNRPEVLSWLHGLLSSLEKVHIIALSRNEPDIEAQLKGLGAVIQIQSCDTSPDISRYIEERILSTASGFPWWKSQPTIREEIKDTILKRSDGMLAVCQLQALGFCLDPQSLRKALLALPRTLSEMYARAMSRILEERREGAIRLLQFLVYSPRPLTVEEALEILAVDFSDSPSFSADNRPAIINEITGYCPSLLTLDRSSLAGRVPLSTKLSLAHSTVMEYLKSDRIDNTFDVHFRSLSSVNTPDRDGRKRFPFADYSQEYLFLNAKGAETAPGGLQSILAFLKNRRAVKTWACLHSADTASSMKYMIDEEQLIPSSLFLTACFGLQDAASWLIRANSKHFQHIVSAKYLPFGFYLNRVTRQPTNTSPLYAACRGGHEAVASILLRSGFSAMRRGGEHGTALEVACYEQQLHILPTLIESLRSKPDGYHLCLDALHVALSTGSVDVAWAFLTNGLPPNVEEPNHDTAIHEAACNGQPSVIKLLLTHAGVPASLLRSPTRIHDSRLPINLKLRHWLHYMKLRGHSNKKFLELFSSTTDEDRAQLVGNALHAASVEGHKDSVEMLLKHGMNPNTPSGIFGSALQAAAAGGHIGIVELLLKYRADVNSSGGFFGSPLRAAIEAAAAGNERAYRRRFAKRDDVDEERHRIEAVVIMTGCQDMPLLLLQNGAKPMHPQEELCLALELNEPTVADAIIKYIAEVGPESERHTRLKALFHPEDGDNRELLHMALAQGFEGIARTVLDEGAEVDVQDSEGRTLFHFAAYRNSNEIMDMLIDAAIASRKLSSLLRQDKNGDTVLHVAVLSTKRRILATLQSMAQTSDSCAELPLIQNHGGMTALHLAADVLNLELIERLIDLTPETLTALLLRQNRSGMTALHITAARSSEQGSTATSISEVLIQAAHESNVLSELLNMTDEKGRAALHHAAFNGTPKLVSALLRAGSDPALVDHLGYNFIDNAIKGGKVRHWSDPSWPLYQGIFDLVIWNRQWNSTSEFCLILTSAIRLYHSTEFNLVSAAEETLNEGLDDLSFVNAQHAKSGMAPLHWAARNGSLSMVKLLLTYEAEVDIKNASGETPLYYAVKGVHLEIVNELIIFGASGASVSSVDRVGRFVMSPLDQVGRSVMCPQNARTIEVVRRIRELERLENLKLEQILDEEDDLESWDFQESE